MDTPSLILAHDLGTTGNKAMVVETVEPNPAFTPLYDELAAIFADSYAALAPIHERLHDFAQKR